MSDVNPMKETFLLGAFHIVLPTGDVYSDLALTTKLFFNNHPNWASLLLGPVLINYTLCWIAWFTTDKQKKFTWIAALLGCYPQLVAARIIWLFWKEPSKGVREKKNLERNLIENEIFTEAVPSSLIMTFLWLVSTTSSTTQDLIVGDVNLFLFTFTTSVLSVGLGLAKCLKVGPCRVLAEGGCLGGLLAPRFLLIFAACLLSLLGKGFALASPFVYRSELLVGTGLPAEHKVPLLATIFATMFLPGLLLGLISCWHRGILKTFIAHPSILLLPTFTHFTFASSTKWCKRSPKEEGKEEEEEEEEGEQQAKAGGGGGEAEEPFIVFSPKFTLLNILISTMSIPVYCLSMRHIAGWDYLDGGIPIYLRAYLYEPSANIPFILVPIFGLLFTLLSVALTSTRQTCCSLSNSCCCCTCTCTCNRPNPNCCTCSTLPRVEYGALLASKPSSNYILDNGKPKRVPEDEEVKREETEMVDNEEEEMIEKQDGEMVELVANQAGDNLEMDLV